MPNPNFRDMDVYYNLFFEALDHAQECILFTDEHGMILYMNKTYEEFLGVSNTVGMDVKDVIENTRMHIVAQTRVPEIASIQRIKGHDMIANRIPIVVDGELKAVFGTVTFKDVRQLYALHATVERLSQEVDFYKSELRRRHQQQLSAIYGFDEIIGNGVAISDAKRLAKRVAKTDSTVLISGESGTGKELFAHAIHANSHRAFGPFIRVNCAAIPEPLLESELFGYHEGAFTGASRAGKKGKFELAHRGTILLDEIGDMPLSLQAKLLRVLQEKEIEKVGGTGPTPIDVRVISSTHRNLEQLVQEGQFRQDLFYRLNVVTLQIPALRERMEDLTELVYHILGELRDTTHVRVDSIREDVWRLFEHHRWPGNIRELRNVLERALYLMEDNELTANQISLQKQGSLVGDPIPTLKESIIMAEKTAILRALKVAEGDKEKAARMLNISKSGFYQKLSAHGINESTP